MKYLLIFLFTLSFTAAASDHMEVAEDYIDAISSSDFQEAASFISPTELSEMHVLFKELVSSRNEIVLSVLTLDKYSYDELNSFSSEEVYAALTEAMLSVQNQDYGHFSQRKVIGVIKESDIYAHAIVRDSNSDKNSIAVMMQKENGQWYIRVPAELKGMLLLHLEFSKE